MNDVSKIAISSNISQSSLISRIREEHAKEDAMSLLEEKLEEKYKTGSFIENWTKFVLDGKHLIV